MQLSGTAAAFVMRASPNAANVCWKIFVRNAGLKRDSKMLQSRRIVRKRGVLVSPATLKVHYWTAPRRRA